MVEHKATLAAARRGDHRAQRDVLEGTKQVQQVVLQVVRLLTQLQRQLVQRDGVVLEEVDQLFAEQGSVASARW